MFILDRVRLWTLGDIKSDLLIERVTKIIDDIIVGKMLDYSDEEVIAKVRESLPYEINSPWLTIDPSDEIIENIKMILLLLPFSPH